MEPQQPAPQSNPAPTPATPEAVQPPQPASVPGQPSVPATPAPVSSVIPPTGRKGHKLGLILGIVGVVVIILLVGFFLLLLPGLQASNVSNSFMKDITTGNASGAATLTDGGSSNKAFLQQAGKGVSGSYSLKSAKTQSGQNYYLYGLTNATNKYARTIVKKESSGWKITSFVFSPTPLALVPSKVSGSSMSTSSSAQPESTPSDTSGCLASDDFSFFSNANSPSASQSPNGIYSQFFQLQFNPNVATYDPAGVTDPTTVYNDFKSFYAQDANKKYTIELEASVNSSSPDDQLANARNAKVESDLESIGGIPASKITIQPLTNDTSDNNAGDSFFRQVQITLTSPDSCATS